MVKQIITHQLDGGLEVDAPADWTPDYQPDWIAPVDTFDGQIMAVKAGNNLLILGDVVRVDITNIEREIAVVHMKDGSSWEAKGFDAIELVMVLKPSALEGRRLKWRKHAWAFHNMVGHPVMQILAWLGFTRAAIRFHDYTTPTPRH